MAEKEMITGIEGHVDFLRFATIVVKTVIAKS